MLPEFVKNYLDSDLRVSFFLFVGDKQYNEVLSSLHYLGANTIKLSSFCTSADRVPDIDKLIQNISKGLSGEAGCTFMVTGLGEFLALRGHEEAKRVLSLLKDRDCRGKKIILVLRGLSSLLRDIQTDPRFDERRHCVMDEGKSTLSFVRVDPEIEIDMGLSGFKVMLEKLESGKNEETVIVKTQVDLSKSLFNVIQIESAYDAIKYHLPGFGLSPSYGNSGQWALLLTHLNEHGNSLDAVFKENDFAANPEFSFCDAYLRKDFYSWLYFICLKSKFFILKNSYLRFALEKTECFEEFASNVLNAILDIGHMDARYKVFYAKRKELIQYFSEADVASFVVRNRENIDESIYRLTNVTEVERKEIITWISQRKTIILELEVIYPRLNAYLKDYVFSCSNAPEFAKVLTDYFTDYKKQKLFNQIKEEFLEKVEEYARSRLYNRLPTRNVLLEKVPKDGTYLYWLDGLGVEYLSLFESLALEKGLSIRINIARAALPTTTRYNRDFYDSWPDEQKCENNELDNTKHDRENVYKDTRNKCPAHLAKELEIIAEVIENTSRILRNGVYERFLIVSDHGASRLAVLKRQEEKYDTDTTGEHSGRCCRAFPHHDLPYAIEENGYLILADYGRFRGSRAANVEVHGGASLEEVVIPIIELTLENKEISIELLNEPLTADPNSGTTVRLRSNNPIQCISVSIGGRQYNSTTEDRNYHFITLSDIKLPGKYLISIYVKKRLIDVIHIIVKSKVAEIKDDFDELFE